MNCRVRDFRSVAFGSASTDPSEDSAADPLPEFAAAVEVVIEEAVPVRQPEPEPEPEPAVEAAAPAVEQPGGAVNDGVWNPPRIATEDGLAEAICLKEYQAESFNASDRPS